MIGSGFREKGHQIQVDHQLCSDDTHTYDRACS